jgi:hypothetical protein
MNTAQRSLRIFVAVAAIAAAPLATADGTSRSAPSPEATATAPSGSQADAQPKPEAHNSAAPPVCFKLTLHCVGGTGTASAKSAAQPATSTAPAANAKAGSEPGKAPNRPLNLAAPDVRTVVPADQLKEPLPSQDQEADAQEAETVQVKAGPGGPEVPSGFASIWWAVTHPTQAWRILSPAQ